MRPIFYWIRLLQSRPQQRLVGSFLLSVALFVLFVGSTHALSSVSSVPVEMASYPPVSEALQLTIQTTDTLDPAYPAPDPTDGEREAPPEEAPPEAPPEEAPPDIPDPQEGCEAIAELVGNPTFSEQQVGLAQLLTQSWLLRNTGTCVWDESYSMIPVQENEMELVEFTIPPALPGDEVEVVVSLVSPSDIGTYIGEWQLQTPSEESFGPPLEVQLLVTDEISPPSEAPTDTLPVPEGVPTDTLPVPEGVPTDTLPIPEGVLTDTLPVPEGVPTDTLPVPEGVPTDTLPVPEGVPTDTPPVPEGVPTDTPPVSEGVPTHTPPVPEAAPTDTLPISPTGTPIPASTPTELPTETPELPTETATQIPTETPTETPELPTETPELPTETPELPTETPELPTETPELPTETPELPTEIPIQIPTEIAAQSPTETAPEVPTATLLPIATPIEPTGTTTNTVVTDTEQITGTSQIAALFDYLPEQFSHPVVLGLVVAIPILLLMLMVLMWRIRRNIGPPGDSSPIRFDTASDEPPDGGSSSFEPPPEEAEPVEPPPTGTRPFEPPPNRAPSFAPSAVAARAVEPPPVEVERPRSFEHSVIEKQPVEPPQVTPWEVKPVSFAPRSATQQPARPRPATKPSFRPPPARPVTSNSFSTPPVTPLWSNEPIDSAAFPTEPPPLGTPYLKSLARPAGSIYYPLAEGITTVGRESENDLIIDDSFIGWQTVSRRHAQIERNGQEIVLVNLSATNGLQINGQQSGVNLLQHDCTISFGQIQFAFRINQKK